MRNGALFFVVCAFGNSAYDDDEQSVLLQAGIKNHVGGAEFGNSSKREALECTYKVGDTGKIIGLGWNGQDCRGQTRKVAYVDLRDCTLQVGGEGGCNDEWFRQDALEAAAAVKTSTKVCCWDEQRDWWYDQLEFWPYKDEWYKWGAQIMMDDYVVYKGTRTIQGPDDCLQVCLDWESECDWSYNTQCKKCNEVGYTYSWPAANECRIGVGQNGLGNPQDHPECTKRGWGACVAMTKIGEAGHKRTARGGSGERHNEQNTAQNEFDMMFDSWR